MIISSFWRKGVLPVSALILQAWRQQQEKTQGPKDAVTPIPEVVQNLFARAWSAAQAAAEAELAPRREVMAQESVALRSVLEKAQAENDESLRVLELQMESLTSHLAESAERERAFQARLSELSESLGYARAKLEASETEARQRLSDKDARIGELESMLAAALGAEVTKASQIGASKK